MSPSHLDEAGGKEQGKCRLAIGTSSFKRSFYDRIVSCRFDKSKCWNLAQYRRDYRSIMNEVTMQVTIVWDSGFLIHLKHVSGVWAGEA